MWVKNMSSPGCETRRPIAQIPHQLQTNIEPGSTAVANRLQQEPHTLANIEIPGKQNAHRPIDAVIALQVEKLFPYSQIGNPHLARRVALFDKSLLHEVGVDQEQVSIGAITQHQLPQVRPRIVAGGQTEAGELFPQGRCMKAGWAIE